MRFVPEPFVVGGRRQGAAPLLGRPVGYMTRPVRQGQVLSYPDWDARQSSEKY